MPHTANRLITLFLWLTLSLGCAAQQPSAPAKDPAKVMLLGLFHFDNPGLDAVRYKPIDVMLPAQQASLVALSNQLAQFSPTKLLLEYPEGQDATVNARYADYLAGTFKLPRNEIYQLGFRIAQLAGHTRVFGIDVETPAFDAKLWNYLPREPAAEQKLMDLIKSESQRLEAAHRKLTLQEILAMANTPEEDARNKGFYLLLNDIGALSRHFYGADVSANWWHRNFRMYALVQLHARPGERVLVIAGSGHTAVMRDLLKVDGERLEQNVLPYLQGTSKAN